MENITYDAGSGLNLPALKTDNDIWMDTPTIAELFGKTRPNISMHIKSILKEGELEADSVCKDFLQTASDGKRYNIKYYNIDMVLSVGFRVKSPQGTKYRQWAIGVLKAEIKQSNSYDNVEDEELFLEAALMRRANRLEIKRLNKKIKHLKPKAEGFDMVVNHSRNLTIDETSKCLGLSARSLWFKMRRKNMAFQNKRLPRQVYVNKGYFVVKDSFSYRYNNRDIYEPKTYVTGAGLGFLANQFGTKPNFNLA